MKNKVTDKEEFNTAEQEPVVAEAQTDESQSADNVADESFEDGDKSAQMADDVQDWHDKYIRLVAEFDNYRKRTLREKMDLITLGGEDVIKALFIVLDDFDRALAAMKDAKDLEAVKQGVELIYIKLMDMLRNKGVEEIEALGLALDTDLHEAVAKFPVPEEERKGKIIDVVQKGYKLKDKVARFSKVVVGE